MPYMQRPAIYAFFLSALFLGMPSASFAEFTIFIGGATGYYLLPDSICGNVIEDPSYEGAMALTAPYITKDNASSAYNQSGYRFCHSFGKEVAPHVGFATGLAYFFGSGFGLGADLSHGFSIRDLVTSSLRRDSLAVNTYSVIPHDYRIQTVESSVRMRVKHVTLGVFLGRRWAPYERVNLIAGLGIGSANYMAHFFMESNRTVTSYRQANGHEVYCDSAGGQFEAFGIRYAGWYLKPGVEASYCISDRASLLANLHVPLSYIEKGYDWRDGGGLSYSAVFYPQQRFVAGNAQLHFGLRFHLGKKGRL